MDKAFKAAESQKSAAEALKKESTRIAKTLVETSPEEFVEMRIKDGLKKELGKANKGKGKGGKSATPPHSDLADLVENDEYKALDNDSKVQQLEKFIDVKLK